MSFLVSCRTPQTGIRSAPTVRSVAERRSGPFKLTVITAADNVTRLPGAQVFVLHSDGRIESVGMTDQFGSVVIPRTAIVDADMRIGVMVCHPVFYCGIIREQELTIRDEMTIALATRVMR